MKIHYGKRVLSVLLALCLTLSLVPVALAADEPASAPTEINSETVWRYLDDGTDPAGNPGDAGYNRTSWTAEAFDDSAWKTGSGSFGSKKGAIADLGGGCIPGVLLNLYKEDGTDIEAYFFRTTVTVEDASAVTAIAGSVLYDDSATVYLNGTRIAGFDDGKFTANLQYGGSSNGAPKTGDIAVTNAALLSALKTGENTIAVEVHQCSAGSSDIYFEMPSLIFSTGALIDSDTVWSYLDDNTDPAGDSSAEGYDRTSWTAETFDDSAWATAAGPFGSKKGAANYSSTRIANTILAGCDGKNDTPAYFFRATFTIDALGCYTKLVGSLEYDDGVIVYINGQRIAAGYDNACDASGNSLGHGFDANLQYGGSNQGPDTLEIALTDLSILHEGENTIAVELHNGRATSSDVWFSMPELKLSVEEPEAARQTNISLSMGADETQVNFTWYANVPGNGTLTLAKEADLVTAAMPAGAQTFSAAGKESNKTGSYSYQTVVTGLEPGTVYAYQLTNGDAVSEIYTFTSDDGDDTFSFAYVGDPQIGAGSSVPSDTDGWAHTLSLIGMDENFSDTSFLLSAGDQVNTASDEEQYVGYLEHDELTGLPVATVIGNHDSGSIAYDEHFNVPNESSVYGTTNAGGDYYFVYNHVLFLILNSNDTSAAEHRAFMEAAIAATAGQDITWKVVSFHHSVYTVASHSSDSYITSETGFKNTMVPILDELGIDVVLQGHDHVYCRTYMMDVFTPITESDKYIYGNGTDAAPTAVTDPDGILYITANSGSGSKTYNIVNAEFPFSAVQNQEHIPNVSKVTVSDTEFTITTYRTTDMTVVDSFTIYRTNSYTEPTEPTGYKVTFAADEHATVDVYYTQDYSAADETNVTTAVARDSDSGEIDISGDGQVNFKVTVDEGYELASIAADKNYKNLKDSADTKVEGIYRLTKITGDVTVTIATQSTGSGEPVEPEEPAYTPVEAADTRVNGYYDETGSLQLELAGRYNSGAMNADGGSLEIVEYNPVNGFAYAVSGVKGKLIAVDLNGKLDGDTVVTLTGTEYDVKSLVDGFAYGDMTSVAISPDGSKLAVAIQAEGCADNGVVALFACSNDGSLALLSTVTVGVQPDMVTFADDSTILSADEGEPRGGANAADPKGSVSIVTIGENNALTANTVTFDSFDDQRETLTAVGVLVQKDTNPSADFEPEYIAVSGSTAYVSLQEANAIAVLDIPSGTFTGVYPLGFQDYGVTQVDLQKDGEIELATYKNVYGIKMPDGIAVTAINGKTYLLTANEGDSRADWDGLDNEYEKKTSPTGDVTLDEKVVWFNATMWDGLDESKAYVFGGRSFSIYEVTATGLNLVYDSGSGFEEITAEQLPAYFNTSNDKTSVDNRSGKKGPEPESVVTGVVNGRTYAFIALERISGVMVYDVTDPANASFVNYINSREFENDIQGDVSPEGLCFVSAADSKTGNALLLTACEVSGTLAVYELTGTNQSGEEEGGNQKPGGSVVVPPADDSFTGYPVSVEPSVNGTVTISSKSASKGATVTITAAPGEGYELSDLTVTNANGGHVPLTDKGNGRYTFIMPASKVTVYARFTEISTVCNGGADCPLHNFTDLDSGAWYHEAVDYAIKNGIMNGTGSATFAPNVNLSRAMLMTMLARMDGVNTADGAIWYEKGMNWAVTNGVSDGTNPAADISRQEVAAMLYRYAQLKGCDTARRASLSVFTDGNQTASWAKEAMEWAVASGVLAGKGNGILDPQGPATRVEAAQIFKNFTENIK